MEELKKEIDILHNTLTNNNTLVFDSYDEKGLDYFDVLDFEIVRYVSIFRNETFDGIFLNGSEKDDTYSYTFIIKYYMKKYDKSIKYLHNLDIVNEYLVEMTSKEYGYQLDMIERKNKINCLRKKIKENIEIN